jgi:hypothetical protein
MKQELTDELQRASPDLLRDRPSKVVLHVKQVLRITIVILCPKVSLIAHPNQLDADAGFATSRRTLPSNGFAQVSSPRRDDIVKKARVRLSWI